MRRYNQLLDSLIGLVEEASEDKQKRRLGMNYERMIPLLCRSFLTNDISYTDTLQPAGLDETKKLVAAYLNYSGK